MVGGILYCTGWAISKSELPPRGAILIKPGRIFVFDNERLGLEKVESDSN